MANTAVSDLGYGDQISLSPGREKTLPALADGTEKAGSIVGIDSSDGKAKGTDVGAHDVFHGILGKRYDTDIDTAPTAGVAVNIIVPESGKKYIVQIDDPAGAVTIGESLTWSANAGQLVVATNLATTLERNIATVADQDLVSGDLVAIVRWL